MQNLPVVNSINSAEVIHLGERGKPPVAKEDFTLAIQEYCLKRSFEAALCREEIGRLEKFARVDAQRKSLLINMSRYYRDNPRADVAPGVLTLITLLSDNDKGACTLSQAQMGIILYRTRTAIAEAVTRLKASELVRSINGKATSYPTIPRVVAKNYNHVIWVVDALKNVATCPVEPTGRNLSRRADTCSIPVPSRRQVNVATCPVEGGQPVPSTGHNFTTLNSTTLNNERERICEESKTLPAKVAAAIATGIVAATASMPAAANLPDPIPVVRPAPMSLPELTEKMLDAAGPALANPAGSPSLLMFSEQSRWLSGGCDIELDILPAIRARSAKAPPASIRSWSYFTQAVADARARRIAPMPSGNTQKSVGQAESASDMLAKYRKIYDGVIF